MQLRVKAHNGTINDTVRAYAEKRLAKLERRLYSETVVEVTLSREHNPSIRENHSAEAVIHTKGANIVARETAETYEAAIDRLVDKLERQIERYRDKRTHEPRRTAQRKAPAPPPPMDLPDEPAPDATTPQDEAAA
jgi:putative sigma-54 modulation protein